MTLDEIMVKAVVTVDLDERLGRIGELFHETGFHHLIVTDSGKLAGVISDRDFLKHVSPFIGREQMEREQDASTLDKPAHQIMTRRPITARPDTSARKAARAMIKFGISCVPVVSTDQRVVGIVTWRDLLDHAYPEVDTEIREAA